MPGSPPERSPCTAPLGAVLRETSAAASCRTREDEAGTPNMDRFERAARTRLVFACECADLLCVSPARLTCGDEVVAYCPECDEREFGDGLAQAGIRPLPGTWRRDRSTRSTSMIPGEVSFAKRTTAVTL
jgi:hypothetical protein